MGSPGERKISFAVQRERSDSLNSSQTSLSAIDPGGPPHTPVEERKGIIFVNRFPDMPILGSSTCAVNKDMISKVLKDWDIITCY